MNTSLALFIAGIPIGFAFSVYTRGDWWDEPHDSDKAKWIPCVLTLCGSVVVVGFVLYGVYLAFMKVMDITTGCVAKASAWWKLRQTKPKATRTRVAVPTPRVNPSSYRDQAPKPCIACGSPTSLDQDNMDIVERNEEETWRAHNL